MLYENEPLSNNERIAWLYHRIRVLNVKFLTGHAADRNHKGKEDNKTRVIILRGEPKYAVDRENKGSPVSTRDKQHKGNRSRAPRAPPLIRTSPFEPSSSSTKQPIASVTGKGTATVSALVDQDVPSRPRRAATI